MYAMVECVPTSDLISLRDYFYAIETKQSLKVRMKKVRRRERDRQRGIERERERERLMKVIFV